jgi:Arc/MetJ-type ribon-helix-helix transcriptional regulator
MTVDIPADLAPFIERLIAERRFLTESEVLAE